VNHKRLFRIYREERLMVRRRGGRKRALGTRAPMVVLQRANRRWSLDFVADQFVDGRRMRILASVHDYTRGCLALVADTPISDIRTARELDRLQIERGKPGTIVGDNGTELISNAIMVGGRSQGSLALQLAESFIGRLCDELLNETRFRSLPHAHAVTRQLQYQTPPFPACVALHRRLRHPRTTGHNWPPDPNQQLGPLYAWFLTRFNNWIL
jgi:putative transposase